MTPGNTYNFSAAFTYVPTLVNVAEPITDGNSATNFSNIAVVNQYMTFSWIPPSTGTFKFTFTLSSPASTKNVSPWFTVTCTGNYDSVNGQCALCPTGYKANADNSACVLQ